MKKLNTKKNKKNADVGSWAGKEILLILIIIMKKLLFHLGSNQETHQTKSCHLWSLTNSQVWNSWQRCQSDKASVHRNSGGPWSPSRRGAGLPEGSRSPSALHQRSQGCPPRWPSAWPNSQTKTHRQSVTPCSLYLYTCEGSQSSWSRRVELGQLHFFLRSCRCFASHDLHRYSWFALNWRGFFFFFF